MAITPLHKGIKIKPYVIEQGIKKFGMVFLHGLGDVIMFRDSFEQLKRELPECEITLFVHSGMEPLIPGSRPWAGFESFNLFEEGFVLEFPCTEGGHMTKPALCARIELGLEDYQYALANQHFSTNLLAAVHLNGTCNPGSTNPRPEVAEAIHRILVEEGYLPVDAHFEHYFHNPVNTKPRGFHMSVRGESPTIGKLSSLIRQSGIFIGVTSGPLMLALASVPEKTICLTKDYQMKYYHPQPEILRVVDILNFDETLFRSYVREIRLNHE